MQPVHVAAYIDELQQRIEAPSVKQHLAAIRMLFDWLVEGQVIPMNSASAVRRPKHSLKKGKTPVLAVDETRDLVDPIAKSSLIGQRDRALIALITYTFARVGATAEKMRVDDVYAQARRMWVRLHEKAASATICPASGGCTRSSPSKTRIMRA